MFTSTWVKHSEEKINSTIPIRQVYLWVFDKQKNMLIVSKDGKNWQLPGGHPNTGETLKETAIREVAEETGLNIKENSDNIQAFGYYEVSEIEEVTNKLKDKFIQVRLKLHLDTLPDDLKPEEPEDSEAVKYVKKVNFKELLDYIPWMSEKKEYEYLIKSL